jgi:hypothetical protein
MKTSLRQRFLIAVGISAGLLASMNLFAQETTKTSYASEPKYTINSYADYIQTVTSVDELATRLYEAHQNYPALTYAHVYDNKGELMGFIVSGVPQSWVADAISADLMQLEALGNAIQKMDYAYLPESKNDRLTSRVSRKKAVHSMTEAESRENTIHASDAHLNKLNSSY